MANPYDTFPPPAFWRPAVGARNPLEISDLWSARLPISRADRFVTAGSCFAQHISRALAHNGFDWIDAEPGLLGQEALNRKFGYGVFSFRTGNIYTAALLRQWVEWALGVRPQPDESWSAQGRFYDPFRPAIEPDGFASLAEMRAAREVTLAAIRAAIEQASIFVFTLGLTEAWENAETGVVYPMCPGTMAGDFDPARHRFRNYRHGEIMADMAAVLALARQRNPRLQFLLTVSPVPLTATASGAHVLVATTYSKSVLRGVAGDLCADHAFVDYFPSYEIITAPCFRGMFYLPNAREVSVKGVEFVMTHFFAGIGQQPAAEPPVRPARPAEPEEAGAEDVICEEAMLEAFGER
jgi:hypothetical protein